MSSRAAIVLLLVVLVTCLAALCALVFLQLHRDLTQTRQEVMACRLAEREERQVALVNTATTGTVGTGNMVSHSWAKPDTGFVRVVVDPNMGTAPYTFNQVGYISRNNERVALYGQPSPTRRGRWNYYTLVDGIKLPVLNNSKRDCMDEVACEELYDGDVVYVGDLGSEPWTAKVYARSLTRTNNV